MLVQSDTVKPDGTNLTTSEYDALLAADGSIAHRVILEQYGPGWSSIETLAENAISYFDACLANDYAVRARRDGVGVWTIERMAPGSTAWVSVTLTEQPTCDKICSIASDGATVGLYYYDGSSICRLYCGDITATSPSFAAHETLLLVTGLIDLAMVNVLRGYGAYLNSHGNRVLFTFRYAGGGSWTRTDSEVYWPFPFDSLDAAALTDRDVVGFTGDLPPLWGTRAVGLTVTSSFERVQGIVLWTVKNNRWSDYRIHDMVDRDVYGLSRIKFKMTVANGILFATYLRYTIFKQKGISGIALDRSYLDMRSVPVVIRSKDGLNWDFPEFILRPDVPIVLLPRVNDLLAVDKNGTLLSAPCAWAGQTPASQDITHSVLDMRSTAGDMRTSIVELANPYQSSGGTPVQELAGTLIENNYRQRLKLYLGYYAEAYEAGEFVLDTSYLDSVDYLA